jgi:erythritol transport system substrate-binding protein
MKMVAQQTANWSQTEAFTRMEAILCVSQSVKAAVPLARALLLKFWAN